MQPQNPDLKEMLERLNEQQAQATLDLICLFVRDACYREGQKASEQVVALQNQLEKLNAEFEPMRTAITAKDALMITNEARHYLSY